MSTLLRTRKEDARLSPALRGVIYTLLFLLSAAAAELTMSVSTSPMYSDYCTDSAMFQTIGKYWAEGYLPYVYLFDHKGPLIFFIDALGYAAGGKYWLFAMQIIFFAGAEYAAYRLIRCRLSRTASLVLALLLPFFIMPVWQEGNTIEEYGEYAHPPRYAFIYGLFFAFSFLTRPSNALPVCVAAVFIAVVLVIKGREREFNL